MRAFKVERVLVNVHGSGRSQPDRMYRVTCPRVTQGCGVSFLVGRDWPHAGIGAQERLVFIARPCPNCFKVARIPEQQL